MEVRHAIHRVTGVARLGAFRLLVSFEDRTSREIDFEPVLKGEVYGPLRDSDLFALVAIDPEVHTLVWPTGADFDPAILHDWPEHEVGMRELAERWALVGT